MHHPTDRITHTAAFITPVIEHWLEQEISQWVHHEGLIRRPIAPWVNALTTELQSLKITTKKHHPTALVFNYLFPLHVYTIHWLTAMRWNSRVFSTRNYFNKNLTHKCSHVWGGNFPSLSYYWFFPAKQKRTPTTILAVFASMPKTRSHNANIKSRKEGNVYLMTHSTHFIYGYMVKDHSDSEKGNPLLPHRLLLSINSKGYFICTIPQTG